MDLRKWLNEGRGRNARLATRLGIAPGYLSQMADGKRPIPHAAWRAIEAETEGQVTRVDLWPNEYWLVWTDLPKPAPATKAKRPAKPAAEKQAA